MSLLKDLVAIRQAHQLSQTALAQKAGLSRMTVNKIETGTVDPQLSTLEELARALEVELLVVPKSLRAEVAAFLQSGGRYLGQPIGAEAPPSVVDQVLKRP